MVTVAWGGDVNIGRRFHYCFTEKNSVNALSNIDSIRLADLFIINLECVISNIGVVGIEKGERASYYYRARPEMIEVLLDAGVDVVATANNHSGDYGFEALLDQAKWLDSAGIAYAGSGAHLEEALKPAYRSVNGINIAVFSLDATQKSFAATETSGGHAYLSLSDPLAWYELLAPLISKAREKADVIFVAVHWGDNNQSAPHPQEIKVGHAIIDAGADAVLGSSAHMLQGIEIYKDRPIIHDAGDLLFDAMRRDDTDTGIFSLDMNKDGVHRVRFSPLEIGFCETIALKDENAVAACLRFSEKCRALGTHLDISPDGEGIVELMPPVRQTNRKEQLIYPRSELLRSWPITVPREEWLVEEVPEKLRLETPVRLGPLELIGVGLTPNVLDKRGLLFVESYWRLVNETEENWRLDFRASSSLGTWGVACDHDPCDWMWPTSRGKQGTICRDLYSLRPPVIKAWVDTPLKLSVGLVCNDARSERVSLPVQAQFSLSPKEAAAVLRANPPKYKTIAPNTLASTPQILWTAEQIEQITGGQWINKPPKHWCVSAVSHKSNMIMNSDMPEPRLYFATDQKTVARHELYSNLAGKYWNSSGRLIEMQDKLAGGVVTQPIDGLPASFPLLQVDDPLHALMELGVAGRERLKGKVVAITGSAGKTSIASMLSKAMSSDKVVRTNATSNYNSRVGILHLLANTAENTDLVVLEAAVSAINAPDFQNIKLVRPDIAIVTNIAPSHLPPGKGVEYVAQRKANIFRGVNKGGWAVIYRETAFYEYLCRKAKSFGLNVFSYGVSEDSDIRLNEYDPVTGKVEACLKSGLEIEYRLAAEGLHMALNSLACIAVRHILGQNLETFLSALSSFEPAAGRGKTYEVVIDDKCITLIDESYNANPLSMRMAFSLVENKATKGRKVLVLADMLELGDNEVHHHEELLEPLIASKPDCVLLCGALMRNLSLKLHSLHSHIQVEWFENSTQLRDEAEKWIQNGDLILLKGSNSMKLDQVLKKLSVSMP